MVKSPVTEVHFKFERSLGIDILTADAGNIIMLPALARPEGPFLGEFEFEFITELLCHEGDLRAAQ